MMQLAPVSERMGAMQPSIPREAARVAHPANADRKPAILTIRKPGKRFADVPDLTPEEHQRRGVPPVSGSVRFQQPWLGYSRKPNI
jgi:hypothetical protein